MSAQNYISSAQVKGILFVILFCSFGANDLFAQNDKERTMQDFPKNSDVVYSYENPEYNNSETRNELNSKQNNQILLKDGRHSGTNVVKKDNPIYKQGSDKELKKEGMSTLSFNLFLYIVDRFKEDN
ncbi:hypothetical protein ACFOUP_14100 [Belliella kenyensis]|uniref:Uncharacterized protein n=1 Tax=Belliella kenyensis TaxID=1472724 RepID=A0ABV8ENC7_9BACT|nr:hypothetical protein [Belliella kenyensis]MCH7401576.1 hypothetical protein [Belliella kenyensis]MDN3603144.1 hypothetical protein [Belliella kenyensis]